MILGPRSMIHLELWPSLRQHWLLIDLRQELLGSLIGLFISESGGTAAVQSRKRGILALLSLVLVIIGELLLMPLMVISQTHPLHVPGEVRRLLLVISRSV